MTISGIDTAQLSASQLASLGEGEQVLWSARPRPADEVRLDASIWGLPLIWSSFVALVFAIGLYSYAREHGAAALLDWSSGVPTPFTMAPILLIGVWLLGAPWIARLRSTRARFVLTNWRLLQFDGAAGTHSKSIALHDLGPAESDEGADGYGALHVYRQALRGRSGANVYWRLRGIPDVARVRRLIAAQLDPQSSAGENW